jgi:hypothetical protein
MLNGKKINEFFKIKTESMRTRKNVMIKMFKIKTESMRTHCRNVMIKLFKIEEEDFDTYNLIYKLAKHLSIVYTALAGIVIFTSIYFSIGITKDGDLQNWSASIFEFGLGLYVSVAIVTYENVKQDKLRKQQKKKENYGFQRLSLLLNLAKNQFKKDNYDDAMVTFDQIIITLNIISDVLDTENLRQILELSEIGKIGCKQKGSFSISVDEILPFTISVPANSSAFFLIFDLTLQSISSNERTKNQI